MSPLSRTNSPRALRSNLRCLVDEYGNCRVGNVQCGTDVCTNVALLRYHCGGVMVISVLFRCGTDLGFGGTAVVLIGTRFVPGGHVQEFGEYPDLPPPSLLGVLVRPHGLTENPTDK